MGFKIEGKGKGGDWSTDYADGGNAVSFATEVEAKAAIVDLALMLGWSVADLRVVEALDQSTSLDVLIEDARQRVGAWKARREGNIDDDVAAAVYALDERYPAGWNLDTFKACLEMIEEGVSPSRAADEA
jgi:hypothetical protein